MCKNCKIIYNTEFSLLDYDDRYFIDQYRDQYGRTYQEDFENIYSLAIRRLETILDMSEDRADVVHLSLLDLGSALGFFLKAAKDSGIGSLVGIEISNFAAEYCDSEYNIDVINQSFEDTEIKGRFNIITAWYFIEHFEHPLAIIKRVYDQLSHKGIFAFSVPSYFGPQYFFNRFKWCSDHPIDHRVSFSPSSVRRLLEEIGFTKIVIQPCGIHPERILAANSLFYKPLRVVYPLISRIIRFSDTMDVFAIK